MDIAFPACALCGAGWTLAVAWRAPQGALPCAARGLLGGGIAFAAAWVGYLLLERAGVRIVWETVAAGGGRGLAAATVIGIVEESAKLVGMWTVWAGTRPAAPGALARTVIAVSAAFATLECIVALTGSAGAVVLVRALLAPVAHAALAAPLALVLAGEGRGVRRVVPGLALAAALHGASDFALSVPGFGRIGYAAALAAPAVFFHLRYRLGLARGKVRAA